jgi:hypothetical protein
VQTPDGILLVPHNTAFKTAMTAAEAVMSDNKTTLRELAK